MTIFLVLNGMTVAFMFYVLVNFWRDRRRSPSRDFRVYRLQSISGSKPKVFVVTRLLERDPGQVNQRTPIRFPLPDERLGEDESAVGSRHRSKRSA